MLEPEEPLDAVPSFTSSMLPLSGGAPPPPEDGQRPQALTSDQTWASLAARGTPTLDAEARAAADPTSDSDALAVEFSRLRATTLCGSSFYMAPEV